MSRLLSSTSTSYYTGQNEYANHSFLDGPHRTVFVYGLSLYVWDQVRTTWPSSQLLGGWANDLIVEPRAYDSLQFYKWSGSTRWVQIAGITRNASGVPIGGVTVKVYRTSDDLELMSTVSADDGAYQVATNESFQCYLVAYKAGAPDVEGTTRNDLVGS